MAALRGLPGRLAPCSDCTRAAVAHEYCAAAARVFMAGLRVT